MRTSVKNGVIVIIAVALMLLVTVFSPRVILPTGSLVAPLAGIIGISALLTVSFSLALLITMLGLVGMYLLGAADEIVIVAVVVTFIAIALLRNRQTASVSHQQLILFGLVAGILMFVLIELGLLVRGWLFDGQWSTALAFGQLGLSLGTLTALLYAALVAPVTIGWRKALGRWNENGL